MTITDTMKQRLAALEPSHIELIDDSYKHAGHGTGEAGVYRLLIVSERFAGLGTMARHRLVYDALGDLMGPAIHALSITARTAAEQPR
ncbi:MAG: BolA family transcriptional regulator [Rhodocyclales bacterium]|nr:BolA family transcriptional regulator [Rhodocyclales bacterium]